MYSQPSFKGYAAAILSAATFGTIPLFSIPVMAAGMALPSVLIYRFLFGCGFMLCVMLWNHQRLGVKWTDLGRISLLAFLYAISAICLFQGYHYLPSGIATTLLFSYPVWTTLMMMVFFHRPLTPRMALALVLAVGGVCLLSDLDGPRSSSLVTGVAFELVSGLAYAAYMVLFPHLRVRKMPSLKINFYIFLITALMMAAFSLATTGRIEPIQTLPSLGCLLLLGMVPTTLSNVMLVIALKEIDSTQVAVLGAFEPLTAMTIGILVMHEPLTAAIVIGFLLILLAVIAIVTHPEQKPTD